MDLRVSGKCNSSQLHASLQPGSDDRFAIDLTRMEFGSPAILAAVAAHAERGVRGGFQVEFSKPNSGSVSSYLSRMRLGDRLTELGVEHGLADVRSHDTQDRLLELSQFSRDSVESIATHVFEKFKRRNRAAAVVLFESISEFGQNVIDHSRRSTGFALAQDLRHAPSNTKRVWFAVSDSGRGFAQSLRHLGATTSLHALEMAVQGGHSSLPESGRGWALSRLAQQVVQMGGGFNMLSGDGTLMMDARRRYPRSFPRPMYGSLIEAWIPLS